MKKQNVTQIRPYQIWQPKNKPDVEIYQHTKSKDYSTVCRVQEHRVIDITQEIIWCYPTYIRNPILTIIGPKMDAKILPFRKT